MVKKHRILIVNTEENIVRLVAKFLEHHSYYNIAIAYDANDALKYLKNEDFDLLITSYIMPRLSGAELAKIAGEIAPKMKVIVMTGYDLPRSNPEEFKNNYHIKPPHFYFLLIPISLDSLIKIVQEALGEETKTGND